MRTMMTEQQFNEEFTKFSENVKKAQLTELNMVELEEQLKTAAGALTDDTGLAWEGGLIYHINLTTGIAQRLAKMVSGTFNITEESLLKVCTLMHLSKIEMYMKNDNEWEIRNRGMNFKFAPMDGKLRFGERSILYAMNRGIKLTAEEFEAMRCLDRESEDKLAKCYDSILSTIIRQANELAYAIERERLK